MAAEQPDEFTEKIKILATDDQKIKSFGELLTSDSSRQILQTLFGGESTAMNLSQRTGISLQLVRYHLNKMQDMGIVRISRIEKNSKSQDMKVYAATKFSIVIVPPKLSEKTRESKLLVRSFRHIYKVAGLGLATGFSALLSASQLRQPVTRPEPESVQGSAGSVSLDRAPYLTGGSDPQEEPAVVLEDVEFDSDSVTQKESSVTPSGTAPQTESATAPDESHAESFTDDAESATASVSAMDEPATIGSDITSSPTENSDDASLTSEEPSTGSVAADSAIPGEPSTVPKDPQEEPAVTYSDSVSPEPTEPPLADHTSAMSDAVSFVASDLFLPLVALTAVLGGLTVFYLIRWARNI